MTRLMMRVDGFDLCWSLRAEGWHRSYQLDGEPASKNPAKPVQQLVVNKFTARVEPTNGDLDQKRRQQTFSKAYESLPDLYLTTTGATSRSPAYLPGHWPGTRNNRS